MIQKIITITELSSYLGISPRRIQQLSKAKIIPKIGNKYELFTCLTAYFKYLRRLVKQYSGLYQIEVQRAGRRTRFENMVCFEDLTADVPASIPFTDEDFQEINFNKSNLGLDGCE
jgi:hypothetical protein